MTSTFVRVGGADKQAVTGSAVKVGDVWRDLESVHIRVGEAWEQVFSAGTVTITGASISASAGSGPVVVRLLINTDGTLDKDENGTITQLSPSTDWIIPNSAANSNYEVRFINYVGNGPDGGTTLTEDVWAPIDQQHIIRLARTGAEGNGTDVATFDLEIRLGSSGPALDSGSFTLSAQLT